MLTSKEEFIRLANDNRDAYEGFGEHLLLFCQEGDVADYVAEYMRECPEADSDAVWKAMEWLQDQREDGKL